MGQFEAFSEIMLRKVMAGGVEEKNKVVPQHFPGPHESLRMPAPLLGPPEDPNPL